MFKIVTLLALALGFSSAQFLNDLRVLQSNNLQTLSATGGTWLNVSCPRYSNLTTDICQTGTCCAQLSTNGSLSMVNNATFGYCYPVTLANSMFAVNGTNWTIGGCLLNTTTVASVLNTNLSSCTAGQCVATLTSTFVGSTGNLVPV